MVWTADLGYGQAIADLLARITFNPLHLGGKPCIRGMRIRVADVLGLLAAGMSEAEILRDYPDLEAGDIRASLLYAAQQLDHSIIITQAAERDFCSMSSCRLLSRNGSKPLGTTPYMSVTSA